MTATLDLVCWAAMSGHSNWLAPLDLLGLALVALLVILGTVRGLWWQAIRLAGIVLAVVCARILVDPAAGLLRSYWPELSLRASHGIAWTSTFVLVLAAAALFGLLGQRMLEVLQLGLANRVAGAFAGALTGLLAHLAVLVVVCQLAPEPFVGRHVAGSLSGRLYQRFVGRWPVVLGAEGASELKRVLAGPDLPQHPAPAQPTTPAPKVGGGVVR